MTRLFATTFILFTVVISGACTDVPDISLPNEPPVANDDVFDIRQNQVTLLDVLQNDVDIDGDPLTLSITETTINGTLLEQGGIVSYTPNDFFVGTDTFSYEITDLVGHVSSATVTINIARFESRAIFESVVAMQRRLLMIDSREPTAVIELSQSLNDGEAMLNWGISEELDLAVILTDADRLVLVGLGDASTPMATFEIDTANGPIDGGLIISNSGSLAAVTLGNRYIELINLAEVTEILDIDTGFAESTLQPSFFSQNDSGLILEGTLGLGAEEHAAIYFADLSTLGLVEILDDAENMDATITRLLTGLSNMAWLTQNAAAGSSGSADSCTAPPPQIYSDLSQSSLTVPGPGTNLNEASGVLPESTAILSYNNAPFSLNLYAAACPPDEQIVQIFEIPFLIPDDARVIATATDASDSLWNIDVSRGGQRLVYVLEGDSGFRVTALDLSGDDPVATDITAMVPDFQTFTAESTTALPQSIFSSDGRLWLFLAPVDDALTRVGWINLETSEVNSVDLPFPAANLTADGFFAFVQGETAGDGSAPIGIIELINQQLDVADVPGSVPEFVVDPLNDVESVIDLFIAN